jgi:DNA-binding MarR family transcriptional regulator
MGGKLRGRAETTATALLQLVPWIERLVSQVEGKTGGLTMARAGLLFALTENRLRGSEIADRWGISRASVGEAAQTLERLGFLRRVADPEDRRASLFVITAKGQRALERFGMVTSGALAPHIAKLDAATQDALADAATALAKSLAESE